MGRSAEALALPVWPEALGQLAAQRVSLGMLRDEVVDARAARRGKGADAALTRGGGVPEAVLAVALRVPLGAPPVHRVVCGERPDTDLVVERAKLFQQPHHEVWARCP
eukprot:scaffold103074_cov59-Phaeocystis_antarctica.AAC.4